MKKKKTTSRHKTSHGKITLTAQNSLDISMAIGWLTLNGFQASIVHSSVINSSHVVELRVSQPKQAVEKIREKFGSFIEIKI